MPIRETTLTLLAVMRRPWVWVEARLGPGPLLPLGATWRGGPL